MKTKRMPMPRQPAQPTWDFQLDSDEGEHLSQIEDKALLERLGLINAGARLAATLAVRVCERPKASSREVLLGLLVIRAADQLRVTAMSLTLGHYHSVPLLLHAAVDTLSTLHHAASSPKRLKTWALLSSLRGDERGIDAQATEKLRGRFHTEAREAYDALLAKDADQLPVLEAMRGFNREPVPVVDRLYETLAVSPRLKDVFEEKTLRVLQGPRRDLEKALASLELRPSFKPSILAQELPEGVREEDLVMAQGVLYNEDLLDHYVQIAHVATHHLYLLAEANFKRGSDAALVKAGAQWLERSQARLPAQQESV
ncbi:MAG: hypothetical protein HYX97_04460 [Chloroflexi bacterium]|nr:hypothetical protein [Chloroflexota bacterium]